MSLPPSLPPLNPEKTASGIIVDPRTLERVIPASRRKDGSLRKEQKVRAGFVPQEDMSAFRGRRQLEAEARRGVVPGSSGRVGLGSVKADNPFAEQQAEKSKAAIKNDKRKVKRTEVRTVHRHWDSETDSGDDEEATRRAFAALRVDTKSETAFPPLGGSSAQKASHSRSGSVSPVKPGSVSPRKSVWKTLPDPISTPAAAPHSSSSAPPTSASTSASDAPSWRSGPRNPPRGRGGFSSSQGPWTSSRPHPIQGGRQGPCGLAHPPPIEPVPSGSWRGRGTRGDRGFPGRGRGRGGGDLGGRNSDRSSPAPAPEPRPPRTREPVRIRDSGPLADRVRNLLVQNQASPDRPRKTASASAGVASTGGAAASSPTPNDASADP